MQFIFCGPPPPPTDRRNKPKKNKKKQAHHIDHAPLLFELLCGTCLCMNLWCWNRTSVMTVLLHIHYKLHFDKNVCAFYIPYFLRRIFDNCCLQIKNSICPLLFSSK